MQMTISEKIRQLRGNLTQADFASRLGLTQSTVANWEKEYNGLTLNHCRKICKKLNIRLSDFFKEVE